jgi:hypothetical protein
MRSWRRSVATSGDRFGLFMRFSGLWRANHLRPVAPSFFQSLSIESGGSASWSSRLASAPSVSSGELIGGPVREDLRPGRANQRVTGLSLLSRSRISDMP